MSVMSIAGIKWSEITLVYLNIHADSLGEKHNRWAKVNESRYGPYLILMNTDGIDIYTKAHLTNVSDQVGRTFIRQEELKFRHIRHNAMLEPDAVHIVCEAGLAAHVLEIQGKLLSVKGLLDTGPVASVEPISTWTDMGFDRRDFTPMNIQQPNQVVGAMFRIRNLNELSAIYRCGLFLTQIVKSQPFLE